MGERNNDTVIIKAMEALQNCIKSSKLSSSEQDALLALTDKLEKYYLAKSDSIINNNIEKNAQNEKMALLRTFIIDIIVEINTVLVTDSDIHYFVNTLNKKLVNKNFK